MTLSKRTQWQATVAAQRACSEGLLDPRGIVVLIGVLFLLAACGLDARRDGVQFVNQMDVAVDVSFIDEKGEEHVLIRDLDAGTQLLVDAFSNDCSFVGDYVARDASGREVARRTGPICRPDRWVIEPSPGPDS